MCDRQTDRQACYDSVVRTVHLRASSNSETILLVMTRPTLRVGYPDFPKSVIQILKCIYLYLFERY